MPRESICSAKRWDSARFKRSSFAVLALSVMLSAVPAFAATGVPRILHNQGRLMDSDRTLLGGTGTEYCFKFSIYDDATVGSGTKLWPSSSPSTMTVNVRHGIYNVGIGDTDAGGDALDFNFQDTDGAFLNVEVATKVGATCAPGDGAESFENLSPRQRILAAGYAINAGMVGGFLASQDASGNEIPVLNMGRLVLGDTNASINATSTNALTLQGGGEATGDIRFFHSGNRITSAGNMFLNGLLTASSTLTDSVLSTNITATGIASTSQLVVSNTFTFGTGNGVLKATAGTVSAGFVDLSTDVTNVLGIANGGTGTSTAPTYGQVLVGNSLGGYDLRATSTLGIVPVWGTITGTLSSQTDLQSALDARLSLAAWYATTTDALAQGTTNRYYSDSLVNTFLGASTTVPKTFAANTFTNSNTFSGAVILSGSTLANSIVASSFGSSVLGVGTVATSTLQGNTTGTSTIQGFVNVLGTNSTSTFSGGLAASQLNLTGTNATSTFASGVNMATGCYAINGVCIGTVLSVSNSDSSLTVSPTNGNVVVSLNLSNANVWTGLQRFGAASTTAASALDYVAIGRTATTTLQGNTTGTSTVQGFINVLGTNSTSTFSGGVSATRLSASATSTLAGVRLTNSSLLNCTEALETDASGNIICGNDAGVDGVTVTSFAAIGAGNTWTKANYPNLTFTQVIVTAGGGGGGGANGDGANENAGGGGGAGGTSISMIPAASLGNTETVTVGARGTAGNGDGGTGGTGGNSSFGSLVTALGGLGGVGDTGAATCTTLGVGGVGGATTTTAGDIKLAGGGGGSPGGCIAEFSVGGVGGSSYWGGGGAGGEAVAAAATAGDQGLAYGAGGGGAANVDTNTTGATGGVGAQGVVVTMNYTSSGADLAEWYETKEDVEVGDVVAISTDSYEYDSKLGLQKSAVLEKATAKSPVVGVVSTAPYESMGYDIFGKAAHPQPIALAGRVPVKVSLENGAIKAGDLLTVSSVPGHAMRATKAGVTIGRAIEDSACVEGSACIVLVIVNTSYTTGALVNKAFKGVGIESDGVSAELDVARMLLAEMLQQKKNITASTTLSEISTDRLAAGLEIITPRVISETLVVSAIEPVEKDVRVKVSDDGLFIIERVAEDAMTVSFDTASTSSATSTLALSIDALGNAIFSGALSAADIVVGSPEKPGGITMYDTDTGEPYCAKVIYGRLETFAGTCAELAELFIATAPEPEPEPDPNFVPPPVEAEEPAPEVGGTATTTESGETPEEPESTPAPIETPPTAEEPAPTPALDPAPAPEIPVSSPEEGSSS